MAFGINIPVAFKLNSKALKDAKHELGGFGESLKKGLEFAGLAMGAKEVFDLAKESVMLAAQDIRSRKLLDLQIKNSTHSTEAQVKASEKYLDSLSLQIGKTKNELRPALANAVRGTGSLASAQKLLKIAYDGSAASGKPVNMVMQALIKAQNGQLTGLYRLAPQLKKTKGGLDDFAASVKGAAAASANPFDRFQVAVDELKIKFGDLLLPMISKFVDYLTTTVVPAVSGFFDEVANPKTDVGKSFLGIKKAVEQTFNGVRDFFALFGGGDAMKGFANIAGVIIRLLPALLALKSIMFLASAGSAIGNLVKAVALIRATGGGGGGGLPNVVPSAGVKAASNARSFIKAAGFLGIGAEALIAGSEITGAMADKRLKKAGIDPVAYHKTVDGNPYSGRLNPLATEASYLATQQAMRTGIYAPTKGFTSPRAADRMDGVFKPQPTTTINVNIQPGTSGPETAKQLVKLLGTFDKINGTNIVTKKGR
jgi:hypothetical protein